MIKKLFYIIRIIIMEMNDTEHVTLNNECINKEI